MAHAVVRELLVYPVKSCQGISLPQAHIAPTGIEFDRSFAVFDSDNFVQDLRVQPKLATLKPSFARDGDGHATHLLLDSTEVDMPTLRAPLAQDPAREIVQVSDRFKNKWWGMALQARCCGAEAAIG
eukprot:gb/GFBE01035735.1/.p1 GENE.gb/GFBE01035735.1/~~gb/GFBE01035735.1/.p1  ORF type:complete len:127 (+),score=22.37 gb/GFBE01035735.1/:1-381(+)